MPSLLDSRIPMGRIGTPASDMARYLTGVILPVDRGYLAR
jgi:hypothetical protein